MSFDTITPVLPHVKAGKLRPLAVTTAKRSSALPDIPTLAESGLPGFEDRMRQECSHCVVEHDAAKRPVICADFQQDNACLVTYCKQHQV